MRKIHHGGLAEMRITIDDLGGQAAPRMGREIRRLVLRKQSKMKEAFKAI